MSDSVLEPVPAPPVAATKHLVEALLFASEEPLALAEIARRLPDRQDVAEALDALQRDYAERGVRLERQDGRYAFRTPAELAPLLASITRPVRRLSRSALETLAVIAWRQPVTRAEIEKVRGVTIAKGTLDLLVDAGWVRPHGRRDAAGRPVTWVTTPAFLDQFGLGSLADLPRLEELEAAGLFASAEAVP